MDFIDDVRTRSGRFRNRIAHLATEEATKSSLVLPFLQMLGYDIFDPSEVVPEYTADVGTKKGEKVDYAVMREGKPAILVECKMYGSNLDIENVSQLFRYFTATEARFGLLTDGITYRFFSDLDQPNVMDTKPFFEFNMLDFTDAQVGQLKRFARESFDIRDLVDTARELKYLTEFKRVIAEELADPSADFMYLICGLAFDRRPSPKARERLQPLAKQAASQLINERVNDRLRSALKQDEPQAVEVPTEEASASAIVTTAEEWEGLYAVKAILRDLVDASRIVLKDTRSGYCTIYLDGWKRICRLYFDGAQKYLGLPLDGNRETRVPVDGVDDLYAHADALREALRAHLAPSDVAQKEEQ